jgi:phasin
MTDLKPMMEVPAQVREFAEKSVNQAEAAVAAFIDAANKSITMIPAPASEVSKKALQLTEQNMKSAFDHARRLVHAKDLSEVMKLQSEYVKQQFSVASDQMKELSGAVISSTKNTPTV